MENIEFFPSPHFFSPKMRRKILCLVIHATEDNVPIEKVQGWFQDPKSGVSAHYLIGRDGKIVQMVKDDHVAYHAGVSEWNGYAGVNSISLGIELLNLNNGKEPYPIAQMESCAELCALKAKEFKIELPRGLVGHKDIAPGRKIDPAGFDWDKFRLMVGERLV